MERREAHDPAPTATNVRRAARRATRASAKIENREVPVGHVRSAGVERILAELRGRNR